MNLFRRHAAAPAQNERSFERIRMVVSVLCRQKGGDDFTVFTDDVSEVGVKFISQQPVRADEDIQLAMPLLPGRAPVSLTGRVVWTSHESEHQFAGGISFLDLEGEKQAAWREFIARNRKRG